MTVPMIADLGPMEIVLILFVLVLLFGAKKLPELARGSGRALRIFKSETKGLLDDDDEPAAPALEPPRPASEVAPVQDALTNPVTNPVQEPGHPDPDR